jgi:hypothetical protein
MSVLGPLKPGSLQQKVVGLDDVIGPLVLCRGKPLCLEFTATLPPSSINLPNDAADWGPRHYGE